MADRTYSIQEVADEVNARIAQLPTSTNSVDKRSSEQLSVRRIRDYASKGLLLPHSKDGREARYTEEHILQLVALRSLQADGLPERYIHQQMDVQDSDMVSNYLFSKSLSNTSPIEKQNRHNSLLNTVATAASTTPALEALQAIQAIRQQHPLKEEVARGFSISGACAAPVLNSFYPPICTSISTRQWDFLGGRVHLYTPEKPLTASEKQELLDAIQRVIQESL